MQAKKEVIESIQKIVRSEQMLCENALTEFTVPKIAYFWNTFISVITDKVVNVFIETVLYIYIF